MRLIIWSPVWCTPESNCKLVILRCPKISKVALYASSMLYIWKETRQRPILVSYNAGTEHSNKDGYQAASILRLVGNGLSVLPTSDLRNWLTDRWSDLLQQNKEIHSLTTLDAVLTKHRESNPKHLSNMCFFRAKIDFQNHVIPPLCLEVISTVKSNTFKFCETGRWIFPSSSTAFDILCSRRCWGRCARWLGWPVLLRDVDETIPF